MQQYYESLTQHFQYTSILCKQHTTKHAPQHLRDEKSRMALLLVEADLNATIIQAHLSTDV